jgi:putative DNA primase/helicase
VNEQLAKLNRQYPNSSFVLIPKYDPSAWENKKYDSHLDFKAAMNKWKSNPLDIDDAQKAAEEGFRIGWVVPKGYVIVDVDNVDDDQAQECIEKLLEKWEVHYSYNYTSRGIHMLFKDPTCNIKSNSRQKCGINIMIDTRANNTGYIVLPINDPHRQWGKWTDVVEDIPYFLKPLMNDNTESFIGMVDGDGRNSALFKWRTKLECTHKLKDEEIEKCIRIINEFEFETPMANSELFKTVLRQREPIKQPVDPKEKMNYYNKIAEELCDKFDLISRGDRIYKFNGVYYKLLSILDCERLIHFEVSKNLSKAARTEIINFLRIKTNVPEEELDKEWFKIACKNGVINLVTGELQIPSKSEYNTIFIPWNYNMDPPYSPRIDQFMKDLTDGDPIKMTFLYQIAGYTMLKNNLFSKFFIFRGEGGTGKSTFTNLISKMLGDENCSHVALNEFDKDYHLASTCGRLANIDDDVMDNRPLEYTGKFKSIVSGEKILVRQIYAEPMEFTSFTTLMFSCNKLPKIMDKTTGLYRRMVLIELNHKVKHPDLLFMERVTEQDMEYFLFKCVEAIKIALEEGHFRIVQSEQALLDVFRRRQSPLIEWLYEHGFCLKDFVNKRCMTMYRQFRDWLDNNGYKGQMSMFSFKEELMALFDLDVGFISLNEDETPTQCFLKHGEYDEEYRPY